MDDANLASAIAVEDVATAIGVSPRALQTAFRRVRGCSPSNAIFRRRLERARAALITASPSDTVTKIATDLGFFELGRFSVRYREEFGEKPSETLAAQPTTEPAIEHDYAKLVPMRCAETA